MGTSFSITFIVEEIVPDTNCARSLSSLRGSSEQIEKRSIQPSA